MKYIPKLIVLLLVLCTALPAAAADREGPSYSVEVNKGTLIRLPSAASSVIVADPTIADVQVVSPTLVYINGKAVGETSIFAVEGKSHEILHATVSVTHNLSKIKKTLKAIYPDAKIDVNSVDGGLVLGGTVNSPAEAENVRQIVTPFLKEKQPLINMLHSNSSDQVNLRVRVAEVKRSALKRFGIHFENILSYGNFAFGLAQGRDIVDATATLTRSGRDSSIYGGFQTPQANFNGVIDALEDEGLVTILAEPNLTALSGKSASFLAGGEFPIQVVGADNTVGVEYKPFGVSLNFTPTVLSKEKISLLVNPEVSELSDSTVTLNNQSVPIIDTRRATTTVELGSGQSFTVAGLLKNNRSNTVSKFPGLGDLPVLGALFRSQDFQNDQTELVIVVTPYIVRAIDNPSDVADPTQGLGLPSDMERILFGKLYGEYGDDTEAKQAVEQAVNTGTVPRLHGPSGHVLK